MRFFVKNVVAPIAILAILVLVGNWQGILRTIRFRRKANWPLVQATVEEVLAERSMITDGSPPTYRTEIGYSYSFNGEYYSGHYICDPLATESEANRLAEECPKGTILPLRVNPTRPEVSVLSLDEYIADA